MACRLALARTRRPAAGVTTLACSRKARLWRPNLAFRAHARSCRTVWRMDCRRCGRPVLAEQANYEVFERMHYVCFHYEFEHDPVDPDEECSAGGCPSAAVRPRSLGRKAVIVHGTGANPDVVWLPWLRSRLTERGYAVHAPHYPGLNVEPIADLLPRVLSDLTVDADTVLVGHSGGAALLLAVLEHIDVAVRQSILVAGYSTQPNTSDEPVLQDSYDWAAIKAHAGDVYFVNSPDDPYGCDDKQGRALFDRLGGTQIVRNDGHFGDYDQPFDTFPLLDRLID
jgi:predicted alpha/beta hydrolase family esterase